MRRGAGRSLSPSLCGAGCLREPLPAVSAPTPPFSSPRPGLALSLGGSPLPVRGRRSLCRGGGGGGEGGPARSQSPLPLPASRSLSLSLCVCVCAGPARAGGRPGALALSLRVQTLLSVTRLWPPPAADGAFDGRAGDYHDNGTLGASGFHSAGESHPAAHPPPRRCTLIGRGPTWCMYGPCFAMTVVTNSTAAWQMSILFM
ncbi:uncharacterized protein LOC122564590 [Chiloscyllium plagiosum]|uniref:uncharacterized protein LOC122564590 n=1 Tax=Chiloscyllium plagiosum TaxID=36176 RepID=UPI001CB88608|nr:uncharacterized protein LOC122564590 [Chiloscyllium plagiosum]